MKKSTKVISVILSFVMILSMVPMAFAGTLKTETYTKVEELIQNAKLGEILESLVTDLNSAKQNVTGTALRLVFMFMNNDDINAFIGDRDTADLTDEEAAKILLDWLDKELPEWTKDITSQSWYGTASQIAGLFRITLDLKSVDGILKTLYSVCDVANNKTIFDGLVLDVGIFNDLSDSALKNVKRSGGNLNVIYALLQWLKDNMPVIKKAVNGNLNIGIISRFVDTSDIEKMIKNIPDFAKSALYKLVKSDAEIGKFSKDVNEARGEWGTSPYADYTADELLASALIRLIKNNDEVVPKAEAQKATTLSFYGILSEYAGTLYKNFAVDWINDNLSKFIDDISVTKEIKDKFKTNIKVDDSTIDDILSGAKTSGFLGQLNTLVVKVAELVLTSTEYKKLGLTNTNGNNTDLNENVEKICRYILPLMANKTVSDKLGYDFTSFTADSIKDKTFEEMAVAILKLFFNDWFGSNPGYSKDAVASATSLEDLAVLAVYYTATNSEWMTLKFDFTGFESQIFNGKTVKSFAKNPDGAKDLIISMGVGIGAGALLQNATNTKYTASFTSKTIAKGDINGDETITSEDARYALRAAVGYDDSAEGIYLEAADVDGEGISSSDARIILRKAVGLEEIEGVVTIGAGWEDYVDDITDWALNFIKGLPAVVPATQGLTTERGKYDPYEGDAFNKLNLVLNSLIDFRFLSNAGSDKYALDLNVLLNDVLLGNLMEFDLEGLLATFEVNHNSGNILDGQFIPSALGAVDKLITALFKA